jgi:hypothetical protein
MCFKLRLTWVLGWGGVGLGSGWVGVGVLVGGPWVFFNSSESMLIVSCRWTWGIILYICRFCRGVLKICP